MLEKLKVRWGINSNFQILKIFVVFGITGSSAAWVTHPICDAFGITTENLNVFLYWTLRILITVVYKFILVFVAFILEIYFWNFIKFLSEWVSGFSLL